MESTWSNESLSDKVGDYLFNFIGLILGQPVGCSCKQFGFRMQINVVVNRTSRGESFRQFGGENFRKVGDDINVQA